jgi:hypothetical protein
VVHRGSSAASAASGKSRVRAFLLPGNRTGPTDRGHSRAITPCWPTTWCPNERQLDRERFLQLAPHFALQFPVAGPPRRDDDRDQRGRVLLFLGHNSLSVDWRKKSGLYLFLRSFGFLGAELPNDPLDARKKSGISRRKPR